MGSLLFTNLIKSLSLVGETAGKLQSELRVQFCQGMEMGNLSYGCIQPLVTIRFLTSFEPDFLVSDATIGTRIEQHDDQQTAGKGTPSLLITNRMKAGFNYEPTCSLQGAILSL